MCFFSSNPQAKWKKFYSKEGGLSGPPWALWDEFRPCIYSNYISQIKYVDLLNFNFKTNIKHKNFFPCSFLLIQSYMCGACNVLLQLFQFLYFLHFVFLFFLFSQNVFKIVAYKKKFVEWMNEEEGKAKKIYVWHKQHEIWKAFMLCCF